MVLRNSTPGEFAYIWQSKWDEIIAIKIEGTRIPFPREVFAAAAATATATEWNGSRLQDFRRTGTRALSSVLAAAWALFWTFQYPEGSDNYQKNVWYLSVEQIILRIKKQFKLPIFLLSSLHYIRVYPNSIRRIKIAQIRTFVILCIVITQYLFECFRQVRFTASALKRKKTER